MKLFNVEERIDEDIGQIYLVEAESKEDVEKLMSLLPKYRKWNKSISITITPVTPINLLDLPKIWASN